MAINKNHEFDDLEGVKCAIVERNASEARVQFLKNLLELNGYTVIVVKTPPSKVVAKPAVPSAEIIEVLPTDIPETPSTFTLGVTDVTFNPTNAVFGRLLKTQEGKVVTLAYWEQKEKKAQDEIPYFEKRISE